jgi:hypothetical protein
MLFKTAMRVWAAPAGPSVTAVGSRATPEALALALALALASVPEKATAAG